MDDTMRVALGILTRSHMAEYGGDEGAPAFTVSLMTGNSPQTFRQRVEYFDTLAELHRLIVDLRSDGRLGDIGLSVGPDEDREALLDAITDTKSTRSYTLN